MGAPVSIGGRGMNPGGMGGGVKPNGGAGGIINGGIGGMAFTFGLPSINIFGVWTTCVVPLRENSVPNHRTDRTA